MTSENMIQNPDGWFLENRQINPESNLTPMQQTMRIALYDEYRSHATYQKVVDTFGPINPFVHIVQAEERHIAHMEALLMQHGVPPVANDWYPRVSVYASLVENCEAGVAAEIQNIAMYDQLLPYAETPDVRDTFFRLQAASFNHHLPAFRSCVAAHYG